MVLGLLEMLEIIIYPYGHLRQKKIIFKLGAATYQPFWLALQNDRLPCSGNVFPSGIRPKILDKFQLLLENLSNQLPSKRTKPENASRYALFVGFQPDDEFLEKTGSRAGALNMHLDMLLDLQVKHLRTGKFKR